MRAVLAALVWLALAAPAQAAPELVKTGDFDRPTYATAAPGDPARVFVTEQPGRLRVMVDGVLRATPFLDLSTITLADGGERGLLSAAFAPDYATSGRFYVYVTVAGGELQVREYRRSATDPDLADPASGRVVVSIVHNEAANHNGGQLQFGPDGKLWLATGDGGTGGVHAQDPASLLGKLLRVDAAAPAPVVEVVGRGLRNPWRFSFDPAGRIVIADVGETAIEEVDVGVADNYGWPCWEATNHRASDPACDTGTAVPVLSKSHSGDGFCAIVGGYVVRDPGLPTLAGRYLYGDNCAAGLRSADLANPAGDTPVGLSVQSLSSFGEDACGRILVVSLLGPVYRLVDGAPSPCPASPVVPPPPATPIDARACAVSIRVTGLRSVRRRHRLSVALRTDEACRATVSGRIRGVAQFRTATRALVPGRRNIVTLRLTSRGARAVRRALARHRSLRVAVRVRAVDTAGNVRTLARGERVRG